MNPQPKHREQLTELRQALQNLARSTTIGRPLSPIFLHGEITKHADRLGSIIDQLPTEPTVGSSTAPASPATEPKKGTKPDPVKPV